MSDELTLLAEAGAAAVVAAMATDLWQGTRDGVLGLFRRDAPDSAAPVGARLDEGAALVRTSAAPDDVRRALAGTWARELHELLRRDPACRVPLARLTAEVDGVFASGRAAVALEQNNTARDSGTVFAVQHGDIHTTRGAGRATRRDPDDGPQ
ncbi:MULTISPECIES: hypothetical protein [Streptomyces]|uniref:hypothetical protein n=1 Tax=Streptomyces TaxID=1883 RepID=UPI000241AB05|nr:MULTISPECIES: hypothetical protein [Streptomyces]EHM28277.1 hypothetical protein SPW_3301 [Streptomyces sp. W007]MCX4503875.1 hypothetical protein [Streptomyces anulatus]MCX4520462.1 hypothetical protein [Streptomyces anulatus]MCX4603331.1 hypothetical protein [Streptomyces anulatus]WSI79669.1 hypothetical protein OG557_23260 [Streptomyces anulatus]